MTTGNVIGTSDIRFSNTTLSMQLRGDLDRTHDMSIDGDLVMVVWTESPTNSRIHGRAYNMNTEALIGTNDLQINNTDFARVPSVASSLGKSMITWTSGDGTCCDQDILGRMYDMTNNVFIGSGELAVSTTNTNNQG
eukprot:UN17844